jgi:hypothetical protein
MTILIRLAIPLLAIVSLATPSFAKMAAIQTAVPVEDQSQSSIQTAAEQAVETAVRGAIAMGLPKVQLHRAVVVSNMVVVQILATDEAAEQENKQDEPQKKEEPQQEGQGLRGPIRPVPADKASLWYQ